MIEVIKLVLILEVPGFMLLGFFNIAESFYLGRAHKSQKKESAKRGY